MCGWVLKIGFCFWVSRAVDWLWEAVLRTKGFATQPASLLLRFGGVWVGFKICFRFWVSRAVDWPWEAVLLTKGFAT